MVDEPIRCFNLLINIINIGIIADMKYSINFPNSPTFSFKKATFWHNFSEHHLMGGGGETRHEPQATDTKTAFFMRPFNGVTKIDWIHREPFIATPQLGWLKCLTTEKGFFFFWWFVDWLHLVIIFIKKSPKQKTITPCQALIFTPEIC